MNFKEKEIIIKGKKVFYLHRNGNKKEKIVLLHGFPGNYMQIFDFADAFSRNYEVIVPSLPACGGSEPLSGTIDLRRYADWFNAFLEQMNIDTVVIIGHSFGARIALTFYLAYPQKVEKLILITPVFKPDGFLPYIVFLRYKIAELLPQRLRRAFLTTKLYEELAHAIVLKSAKGKFRRNIVSKGIRELNHLDPKTHIELFQEFYKSDLTHFGTKIGVHSLIVAGAEDEVATLRSIKEFIRNSQNISLHVIENAGHLLPFEQPLPTAHTIQQWLNKGY